MLVVALQKNDFDGGEVMLVTCSTQSLIKAHSGIVDLSGNVIFGKG
jgi:hypothetical protein